MLCIFAQCPKRTSTIGSLSPYCSKQSGTFCWLLKADWYIAYCCCWKCCSQSTAQLPNNALYPLLYLQMSWLACICQVFTLTSSPWIRGFARFASEWTLIGFRSEILGPSALPPFLSPTSDEWTFGDSECSGGWFRMSWNNLEQWIECTASLGIMECKLKTPFAAPP